MKKVFIGIITGVMMTVSGLTAYNMASSKYENEWSDAALTASFNAEAIENKSKELDNITGYFEYTASDDTKDLFHCNNK